VFDLFHFGHLKFLENAKKEGGNNCLLIVGIITDEDAAKYKRKPIIEHKMRCEILKSLKIVDVVVETPPLILTEEFIYSHLIDYVIHADDDYQTKFFKVPIQLGKMRYIPYTACISTTKIIEKILNQFNGS